MVMECCSTLTLENIINILEPKWIDFFLQFDNKKQLWYILTKQDIPFQEVRPIEKCSVCLPEVLDKTFIKCKV